MLFDCLLFTLHDKSSGLFFPASLFSIRISKSEDLRMNILGFSQKNPKKQKQNQQNHTKKTKTPPPKQKKTHMKPNMNI